MIIACLIYVTVNGSLFRTVATGTMREHHGNEFVVDFSNAVSNFQHVEGDYTKVIVTEDDCAWKSWRNK
jgi:hypothetical protein